MLVLSRKPGEKVLIDHSIEVTVAAVRGNRVRLAFEAPDAVRILRAELAGPPASDDSPFDRAPRLPPKAQRTHNVKIITFTAGQARQENIIAAELDGLTDDLGECHLLLDFTNVENITSVELGSLVTLHKKMRASGGRLTLFNLNLHVFEVFTVTRLDKLIGICR